MKTVTKKATKKVADKTSPKETADKDLLLSFWHYVNEKTTSKAVNYSEVAQEQFICDFLESTKQMAHPS